MTIGRDRGADRPDVSGVAHVLRDRRARRERHDARDAVSAGPSARRRHDLGAGVDGARGYGGVLPHARARGAGARAPRPRTSTFTLVAAGAGGDSAVATLLRLGPAAVRRAGRSVLGGQARRSRDGHVRVAAVVGTPRARVATPDRRARSTHSTRERGRRSRGRRGSVSSFSRLAQELPRAGDHRVCSSQSA